MSLMKTSPSISVENKSNGHSNVLDAIEPFMTDQLERDIWKLRFKQMVKAVKESPFIWAAPVLLMIILGYNIYDSHQKGNQIDEITKTLTILKTQKEDIEKQADKDKISLDNKLDRMDREEKAYREKFNRDMQMLTLIVQGKYPKSELKGEN